VYLSSCSQGALSTPVEASSRSSSSPGTRTATLGDLGDPNGELRAEFAKLINGPAQDEVAVTFSSPLPLRRAWTTASAPSRHSDFDFPTVGHVGWAQQRRGARVSFAKADGNRFRSAHSKHRRRADGAGVDDACLLQERLQDNVSALAEPPRARAYR